MTETTTSTILADHGDLEKAFAALGRMVMADPVAAAPLARELRDKFADHTRREEAFFESRGAPEMDMVRFTHAELIAKFQEFAKALQQNHRDAAGMLEDLRNAFDLHERFVDRRILAAIDGKETVSGDFLDLG